MRVARRGQSHRCVSCTGHTMRETCFAGGCGGSGCAPPMPAVAELVAGTEPERSGGGVRLMLNRVN
jgi:hypothetical protein